MKRILLTTALLFGCSRKAAPPPPPVVNHDAAGLEKLVLLPGTPSSVSWCTQKMGFASSRVPGPDDWELQALVHYPAEQRNAVGAAVRARPLIAALATPAKSCLPQADLAATASLFANPGRDAAGLAHPPLTAGAIAWDGTSGTMFVQAHTM